MSEVTPEIDAIKDVLPRHIHYAEVADYIARYEKKATERRIVVIDRAHFNNGYQWGLEGEEVMLSPEDAKALDKAGQTIRPDDEQNA